MCAHRDEEVETWRDHATLFVPGFCLLPALGRRGCMQGTPEDVSSCLLQETNTLVQEILGDGPRIEFGGSEKLSGLPAPAPRAFSKVPYSHKSPGTTQADQETFFMEPNSTEGTRFPSVMWLYPSFPWNDNRGHESPKNPVLRRKGEVGIREVVFGFVYSSNFLS